MVKNTDKNSAKNIGPAVFDAKIRLSLFSVFFSGGDNMNHQTIRKLAALLLAAFLLIGALSPVSFAKEEIGEQPIPNGSDTDLSELLTVERIVLSEEPDGPLASVPENAAAFVLIGPFDANKSVGAKVTIEQDSDGTWVITNKNSEKVNVPAEKKWTGGPALEKVTVYLLADSVQKDSFELTESVNWKHTFTDLPKYDGTDGHEIQYTIRETELKNFKTAITGNSQTGFVVTNTKKPNVPSTGDNSPLALWIGVMLLSAGCAAWMLFLLLKKRTQKA